MAACDYRLCDVCSGKAFYDANLSYEDGTCSATGRGPYRVGGVPGKYGMRLGSVGDWAVICTTCAKSWRTRIERIPAGEIEYLSWLEDASEGGPSNG